MSGDLIVVVRRRGDPVPRDNRGDQRISWEHYDDSTSACASQCSSRHRGPAACGNGHHGCEAIPLKQQGAGRCKAASGQCPTGVDPPADTRAPQRRGSRAGAHVDTDVRSVNGEASSRPRRRHRTAPSRRHTSRGSPSATRRNFSNRSGGMGRAPIRGILSSGSHVPANGGSPGSAYPSAALRLVTVVRERTCAAWAWASVLPCVNQARPDSSGIFRLIAINGVSASLTASIPVCCASGTAFRRPSGNTRRSDSLVSWSSRRWFLDDYRTGEDCLTWQRLLAPRR